MFFSPIFHVPVNEANILKTSFCFNVFEIHFVCIHIAPILSHIRRRKWQPTPVLLPGKSQGRRSPVSCSPWGREESDRTERHHFHFSLSCTGERNGNPLVFLPGESRDRGAWWAAVYGVAQSRTRLSDLAAAAAVYYVLLCHDL